MHEVGDEIRRDDAAERVQMQLHGRLGQAAGPARQPLQHDHLIGVAVVINGDVGMEKRAVRSGDTSRGGDEQLRRGSVKLREAAGGDDCEDKGKGKSFHAAQRSKLFAVVAKWL